MLSQPDQQRAQHAPHVIRRTAGCHEHGMPCLPAAQQDGDFADAPGNFGFDPLSLGSDPATLKWCVRMHWCSGRVMWCVPCNATMVAGCKMTQVFCTLSSGTSMQS